jgi:hydroxyacylglutathione hydrolase
VTTMTTPLEAAIIPVTPLQQNCTLLWCTQTMRAAFVDPGGDLPRLKAALQQSGATIEKILLTHGHIDHCGQAGILAEDLGVPIEGPHEADRFWIDKLGVEGPKYGIAGQPFEPDRWLDDGETVTVGDLTLGVRHCPGHTPGHVVFHHPPSKLAFVGDVLQGLDRALGLPDGQPSRSHPFDHSAPVADGRRHRLRPRPRTHVHLRPRASDQPAGRGCGAGGFGFCLNRLRLQGVSL